MHILHLLHLAQNCAGTGTVRRMSANVCSVGSAVAELQCTDTSSHLLMQHLTCPYAVLQAALDRFAFMTATTALGVLIALQPLALLKKHIQAYMVGARGVLRKALFSRGVPSRLVAVRGLLYMIVQQLRDLESKEDEDAMEADAELSCSQVCQLQCCEESSLPRSVCALLA